MNKKFSLYKTAKNSQERLSLVSEVVFTKSKSQKSLKSIKVDSGISFQSHLGFGGALTDTAAEVLNALPSKRRSEVLESIYGASGLNYNIARMCIGSSDFSLKQYQYISDGDKTLSSFNVDVDRVLKFPLFKDCERIHKRAGEDLLLTLSPWSPPAFMKTNGELSHGGELLPEYFDLYAKYLVRYLLDLEKEGIHPTFLSVQNEPQAVQRWDSCIYSPEQEGQFILHYLKPEIDRHKLDVKITIWDHNRDIIVERVKDTLSIPGVSSLIWGVAYHWYCSDAYHNLSLVHEMYPDKHIFLSECCVEMSNSLIDGGYFGKWSHGEKYGHDIICDFLNWSEGWVDWNIAVDEKGGPNHAANYCEAPVMVDISSKKIIYNASYYYIGHFSKFIRSGAKRISIANPYKKGVLALSYKNPDSSIVIVIMNETDRDEQITINIDGFVGDVSLQNHSIVSMISSDEKD